MLVMAVVEAVKPAEFGILGPVTVLVDGIPVTLGGPKQRALLAALLLKAGAPVAVEELIDAVWGDVAPPTAAKSVQVSVTNLRRILGRERIRTHGAAYAVEVADDELDARQFELRADEGREALKSGDYGAASEMLSRGLALWRGRVCEDVSFESHVNAEAERLEELHRSALHSRVEADLELGRQAQLVPELERLAAQYPLDEELRGQQMLALYRCGRQGDALQVYRETRRLLVNELGVEPGERLRTLERRILEQDPRLDAPAPAVAASHHVPASRSGRRYLLAGAFVAVTALAVGLAVVESVGSSESHRTIAADSVGVVDAATGNIGATAQAGPEPSAVVYADGAAWVADAGGDSVTKIGSDGRVADTIQVGGNVTGIASSGTDIWAVSAERRKLSEIDPVMDRIVRRVAVGNGPRAVAAGANAVWVANGVDGTISRVDPSKGRVVKTIPVGGTPVALAVGKGAVWVANASTNRVLRLDPASNSPVGSVAVGHGPDAIAAGAGTVWVANGLDGTVSRIDPGSNSVEFTHSVRTDPTSVAVDDGSVWIGSGGPGILTELDARTGAFRRKIDLGNSPAALAGAGRHLWVAAVASPASHRGGTLRLLGNTGDSPPALDPALDWSAEAWQVLAVTNDGLLTYRRVGGIEGDDLKPDLAQSIPTPSDNGRTYTFTLRRGIRYSDGRLVRAGDVRASIERVYRLQSPTLGAFPLGVVGETSCLKDPQGCSLSRGIVSDDRTRTVTFHLSRPNPAFLRILALPVYDVLPAGAGARAHIATGPYRVASLRRGRLLLVRNKRFREWSADAQPAGFPDRISWDFDGTTPAGGARDVLSGRADVLASSPPNLASLAVRVPALLRSDRNGFVQYLFLNTRLPPFDNLDVRRALNLAIDREKVARSYGGPFLAEPTCEVLPPNMAGYQPYCPYTRHPGPAGTWNGPDLTRARRLVARSGTRGQQVTVWTRSDRNTDMAVGHEVVSLLRRLGYRATLASRPGQAYSDVITSRHADAQVGVSDWSAAYPSPANFFGPLVSCGAFPDRGGFNVGRFCDPRIDRMIARSQWVDVERAVVDQAPLVPLVAQRQVTLVSRRVGNYEYHPVLGGVLIDQLWLSKAGSLSVP
jgi:ABC-type transport system substrate-binding protein/DNA-binding SARP family transcriptional activator